jgi:hypothetical protein
MASVMRLVMAAAAGALFPGLHWNTRSCRGMVDCSPHDEGSLRGPPCPIPGSHKTGVDRLTNRALELRKSAGNLKDQLTRADALLIQVEVSATRFQVLNRAQ